MKNKKVLIIGVILLILLLSAGIIGFLVLGGRDKEDGDEKKDIVQEQRVKDDEGEQDTIVEGDPVLVWKYEHSEKLNSIAVSPDGETVAVGQYLAVYIHHLSDGTIEQSIRHEHSVEDMDFSIDGSVLAGGQTAYGVLITNPVLGEEIDQLHGGYNGRVAFSPDGNYLATGNRTGIVWIWDTNNWEEVQVLEETETSWLNKIVYHPSGDYLAAIHWGKTGGVSYINIWDIDKAEIVYRHELSINVGLNNSLIQFSPDGKLMTIADRDEDRTEKVFILDFESREQVGVLEGFTRMKDLSFSPGGSMLAVAVHQEPVTIWDMNSRTLLYTFDQTDFREDSSWVREISFTPDGKHVVVIRDNKTLELWRLPGGEPIAPRPVNVRQPPPLPSDVMFDTNSAVLKSEADPILEEFAQELYEALPNAKIKFIGHTDSRGSAQANLTLSLERATSVKNWFESWARENGVTGWEFSVDGKGDTELKVPDVNTEGGFMEEAGRLNRRVEIEIE